MAVLRDQSAAERVQFPHPRSKEVRVALPVMSALQPFLPPISGFFIINACLEQAASILSGAHLTLESRSVAPPDTP